VAGHGSLPLRAENVAFKIGEAIERLEAYAPCLSFPREYGDMVDALLLPNRLKAKLMDKKQCDKALQKLYAQDVGLAKFLHAASRMTISPDVVRVGNKINIIPDSGMIELDIRILPGQTVEYVIAEIEKALGPLAKDFQIEIIEYYPSTSSSTATPLYEATKEIIGAVYPLAQPVPYFIGSVTDGRFYRQKGTVVYGFALAHDDLTLTEYARMVHGNDERIALPGLELAYQYFYQLPEIFYKKVSLDE
jgi:acetylornithine deacetylase/succinyl-diaminopimelate desuccinylase-like protein